LWCSAGWCRGRRWRLGSELAVARERRIEITRSRRSDRRSDSQQRERQKHRQPAQPRHVSDTERGARNPSWEAMSRLAHGMGVAIAEIAREYDEHE